MQLPIFALSGASIFIALILQLKIGFDFPDKTAAIVYSFIGGNVANILSTFAYEDTYDLLILLSSCLYLVAGFFIIPEKSFSLQYALGRVFLTAAPAIVFSITVYDGKNDDALAKTAQILSYLAAYFIFVFDPMSAWS